MCPIRVIDPATEALVAWFLAVVDREPWTGTAIGVREWPRRGGVTRQPAVLVEAVQLLTGEFNSLIRSTKKPDEQKKSTD